MRNPEFSAVMSLITLLADPPTALGRLQELQAAHDAVAAKEAEADAVIAKIEIELAAERKRLGELEKAVRAREVQVRLSEIKHENELDELRKWHRDHAPDRLVRHMGGLTQEPDTTELAPDPISDRLADPMDLTPGTITTYGGKATRVSNTRRRA